MRRRLFIAICIIAALLVPAAALAAPALEQDAKQLMSQYADAWNKVENGVEHREFSALRQGLNQATERFMEKYPQAKVCEDFGYLSKLYADIAEIWQLRTEQRLQFLPKSAEQGRSNGTSKYFIYTVTLKMNYPVVLESSLESKENGYFVNSVLDNLFTHLSRVTKTLQENIDKQPIR